MNISTTDIIRSVAKDDPSRPFFVGLDENGDGPSKVTLHTVFSRSAMADRRRIQKLFARHSHKSYRESTINAIKRSRAHCLPAERIPSFKSAHTPHERVVPALSGTCILHEHMLCPRHVFAT